ncbi:MAG TPA: cytochrome c peroxidase [Flavipsychrobacter sp.]|nr:cytochrome c peroxidase [Flavipsychrobacter sp.]
MKVKLLIVIAFTGLVAFKSTLKPTPYAFPKLSFFPAMPEAADNPVTEEGVDLGRHLFYDPILSIDSNLACASCHRQEAAFSDGPNTFSAGRNGRKLQRNTLPLFNLAWAPTLFWDGRAANLESQVFHPVRNEDEMNLPWALAAERVSRSSFYQAKFRAAFGERKIDSILIAKAIAQFERTLLSYNSKFDQVLYSKAFFTKEEFEGYELINDMTRGNCLQCHPTDGDALATTFVFSNNGLSPTTDKGRGAVTNKNTDGGKFKVPSLRNIALTAPYMHDGRFKTLEEVLDFYSRGIHATETTDGDIGNAASGGVRLSADEKRKMIAFLHTLSDSTFIRAGEFGNPFCEER